MIDKNRPQIRRTTPNGITVVEFHDQRGEYFDVRGNPISEPIATAAGYDVKVGKREKKRRELEAEAKERIEKRIASEFGDIEKALDADEASAGLRMVEEAKGKWSVLDSDRVLVSGLTKKEAEEAFEAYQGMGGM